MESGYQDENPEDQRCIQRALEVLEQRMRNGPRFGNPREAWDFLRIRLAHRSYEVFAVLWLDVDRRLIEFDEMFRGTVAQAAVYTRELAREAIRHNASSCILSHNHPTGSCDPSRDDVALTHRVRDGLALLDIRVLDHIIVSPTSAFSMASHELL
ncbi:RadC family protein [Variovorax sp. WS11]|uniref:JAB domain-containing protein n=1 Tax=Variovorax sp. WS11 TaxID=1105204 RepID=UPI0013DCBB36|nr:JAB domain-containing protein [Variovorax sp. WS11]NDZ16699.1 DNA repair protein RadC [Variovorax sp. WS11]